MKSRLPFINYHIDININIDHSMSCRKTDVRKYRLLRDTKSGGMDNE